jgi:hypothetical protein
MGKRKNKINGAFAWQTIEMLESAAWAVLSLSARRVLNRVEVELAHHGGEENGKLPVTYEHFAEYGLHRHAVAPAIREGVALGFLEVTEQGKAGNREFRKPSLYRLTYRHTDRENPTDEWRQVKTTEEAERLAMAARTPTVGSRSATIKKQNFSDGKRHVSPPETVTENRDFPPPKTITTVPPPKTITTSISGDGGPTREPGGWTAPTIAPVMPETEFRFVGYRLDRPMVLFDPSFDRPGQKFAPPVNPEIMPTRPET